MTSGYVTTIGVLRGEIVRRADALLFQDVENGQWGDPMMTDADRVVINDEIDEFEAAITILEIRTRTL